MSTWLSFLSTIFLANYNKERKGKGIARMGKSNKFNYANLRLFFFSSYEALPSNYGLGRNMLAGAFAGIAVCLAMVKLVGIVEIGLLAILTGGKRNILLCIRLIC